MQLGHLKLSGYGLLSSQGVQNRSQNCRSISQSDIMVQYMRDPGAPAELGPKGVKSVSLRSMPGCTDNKILIQLRESLIYSLMQCCVCYLAYFQLPCSLILRRPRKPQSHKPHHNPHSSDPRSGLCIVHRGVLLCYQTGSDKQGGWYHRPTGAPVGPLYGLKST